MDTFPAMADEKLTDDQVYEALHAAGLALGSAEGATVLGDSALQSARRALVLLQMGIVQSQEHARSAKDPAEP